MARTKSLATLILQHSDDRSYKLTKKKIPQILKNIDVKDKAIIKNSKVKKSIKIAEKLMIGQGRILVRMSGTESKIRVMGESENKKLLNKCINIISKKIK